MVLETLFNPFVVKKKPWEMFFAGFMYSIIGLTLSFFVFKEAAGLLTVFLIVMACLPLVYTSLKDEEEIDFKIISEIHILKEHSKVLVFLLFLFLGITTALSLAYIFMPENIVNIVFGIQQQAIINVNNNVSGNIASFSLFSRIFLNNLKVLFFCIIFAFLYGSGAIFILTWNASVVATAMGNIFKIQVAKGAALVGLPMVTSYLNAASFSFFRYMTHGLLEMAAYFVAGIAGGIISIAMVRHKLNRDKVLIDVIDLILLSVGILLLAGFVEVYITPLIYM